MQANRNDSIEHIVQKIITAVPNQRAGLLPQHWMWSVTSEGRVHIDDCETEATLHSGIEVLELGFLYHEPWIYLRENPKTKLTTQAIVQFETMVRAFRMIENSPANDRQKILENLSVEETTNNKGAPCFSVLNTKLSLASLSYLKTHADMLVAHEASDRAVLPLPEHTNLPSELAPRHGDAPCSAAPDLSDADASPETVRPVATGSSTSESDTDGDDEYPTAIGNSDQFCFRGGANTATYRQMMIDSIYTKTAIHKMALDKLFGLPGGPYELKRPHKAATVLSQIRHGCVEVASRYSTQSENKQQSLPTSIATATHDYAERCRSIVALIDGLDRRRLAKPDILPIFKKLKSELGSFSRQDAIILTREKAEQSHEPGDIIGAARDVGKGIVACEKIRSSIISLTL